jgi:ElaB/YqjD/DUF883 family membrane-anchored ribosome-binding protein
MPAPSKPRRRSPKATLTAPDSGPFTAELLAPAPAAPVRPPTPNRAAAADTTTPTAADAGADARAVPSTDGASRKNAPATRFDDIVDYREDLGTDFDALASEHPRSSVLVSLACGLVVGLLLGYFAARD